MTYTPMSNLLNSLTHGNGLITTAAYDLDYRLTSFNLKNGTTSVSGYTYAYGDQMNLTGITDTVTAANSNVLSYTASNRLASATGWRGSSQWWIGAFCQSAAGGGSRYWRRASRAQSGIALFNWRKYHVGASGQPCAVSH